MTYNYSPGQRCLQAGGMSVVAHVRLDMSAFPRVTAGAALGVGCHLRVQPCWTDLGQEPVSSGELPEDHCLSWNSGGQELGL